MKILLNNLLQNNFFKKFNIDCKFPKMKKENIKIFKELEKIFKEFNKEDIIFIAKNKNNKEYIIKKMTCECGNIKHSNIPFCSRKCIFFKKHMIEQSKKTCLEKYGVENVYQNKDIINKIKEKRNNKTLEEKINIQQKRKKTCLEKYGFENINQVPEIKNKITNTMLKRYGHKTYSQTNEWLEKTKETNNNKYGVDFYSQTQERKERVEKTIKEKYDVNNALCLGKAEYNRISKINRQWGNLLDIKENDYEFNINGKFFDLKKDNNLIEINPTITHNSTKGCPWIHNDLPLQSTYHINRTKLALSKNYRLIHIWDWDDPEKIKNIFINKNKIYARKCILKEISLEECNEFLNKYHFQNGCKGQNIRLGLYYNNELISLMTFGKPRYNKNYDWELLRYCTHKDYNIIGGAEKLFKYFIVNNKGNIISYCDNSKFIGNVYKKLGFILKSYGVPAKHWYHIKNKKHINNSLLLQLGFDKLFGTNFGKGTSNEELMIKHGFLEVYDCGQSSYEFIN